MAISCPLILQSEAAECGLACLAMVATANGHAITLPEMRRRFSLSLKGARLSQLIEIAAQLGLRARPLRLDLDQLANLRLPCLLHWDLNHFVVLSGVRKRSVHILDPAFGHRQVPFAEVSPHFTGVALELVPDRGFQKRRAAPALRLQDLLHGAHGWWPAVMQILSLSVVLQCFVALAPFFMQWVVDQVLVAADRDLLTVLGLGFGIALLLQTAIGLLRGWAILQLAAQLGLQWQGNLVAHLLRLPLDFFEKRHLGDITSRLGSLQTIQKTLTTGLVETVIDGLMAVLTLALMLAYSARLAALTLAVVSIYLAVRLLWYRSVRDSTEQQLAAAARQQSHLLETLRGIQSLKVAGQEALRRTGYENLLVKTLNQDLRLGRLGLGFGTASQCLFGLERVAVIWLGAQLALTNAFSVGMLIAYLAYKDQFAMRVSSLIDKGMDLRMLRLHAERLADIVLAEAESGAEPDRGAEFGRPVLAADIDVQRLAFRYGDGEPWILQDCSFSVREGESVAIVGASGCGKSTLLKILLGLLPASRGSIRFGGEDLARAGARQVRGMVGAVLQDDQLFAGSIADNISFFDPDAMPTRIEVAARLAAVHDEITAMPMGYGSLIGDMGSALSGGQKQRILLARALYRQPKILLLDEATSHLDVARECQVNNAVRNLRLTRIIIAHRPDTIASADHVLVLESGMLRSAGLMNCTLTNAGAAG
jgi:ATP-binding cassette subfamily B protein RaxB